jgi:adhesin transport system membrane fusion protein
MRVLPQAARLRAEVIGENSVKFSADVMKFPELVKVQRALFNQKNKYFQDAGAELAKTEDDIGQNSQVQTQRNQVLTDSVFRAPVDGIVKNVRITTQGGVLRAGDELMQIVPLDDKLILETKVKPADIAQIRQGLAAGIRFDSFDYTVYGAVNGTVSYVSADTIKEDTKAGEQTYYRVHVETLGNPVKARNGKILDILPGMTAQTDIRTGDRTVMHYILKPLRKTLTESMGER